MLGARLRTLPAAVVPVAVGTAVASHDLDVIVWRAVAALVVAVAIQVGTNYANDYHDGVRGYRRRPGRAGSTRGRRGWLLGVGGQAGRLASPSAWPPELRPRPGDAAVGWELIRRRRGLVPGRAGTTPVAIKPYGYRGLGEVFVFVFFGLVATAGSAYVQTEST